MEVHLDGEVAYVVPFQVAAGIEVGLTLGEAEIGRLREAAERDEAMARALRLVAVRPRSRQEIAVRLERAGLGPEAVGHTLAELARAGVVDDAAFALWWVRDRCAHRPRARHALAGELAAHGVERETVRQALDGLDDAELARESALGRAARYAGLERPAFDRRLGGWLARRGFAAGAVRAALEAAWRSLGDERA